MKKRIGFTALGGLVMTNIAMKGINRSGGTIPGLVLIAMPAILRPAKLIFKPYWLPAS